MKKILIAPSILAADPTILGDVINNTEKSGADWLHIDIMDGHFVPNITFGPKVVESIRKKTKLILDVHLMITYPQEYIEKFADAGADYLTVHVESSHKAMNTIKKIRKLGIKPGIVLNPPTDAQKVRNYLPFVDMVLIMGVNPGFSYQKFIPEVLKKISKISGWVKKKKLSTLIQVDGGINIANIHDVVKAGADVVVAGGAVYGKSNISKAIKELKNAIRN